MVCLHEMFWVAVQHLYLHRSCGFGSLCMRTLVGQNTGSRAIIVANSHKCVSQNHWRFFFFHFWTDLPMTEGVVGKLYLSLLVHLIKRNRVGGKDLPQVKTSMKAQTSQLLQVGNRRARPFLLSSEKSLIITRFFFALAIWAEPNSLPHPVSHVVIRSDV